MNNDRPAGRISEGGAVLIGKRGWRILHTVTRYLRGVVVVSAAVGVAGFAVAALLTVADVCGRKIGMPILGVVDLVQLFVLGGAWLVIPYGFLKGAHVGVDLFVEAFPRAVSQCLRTISNLFAAALLVLILNACIDAYSQQLIFGDQSQQLGIPITYYWLPLFLGVTLSIIAALLTVVEPPMLGEGGI